MKIYVVRLFGSCYDEVYSENEYVGGSIEDAQETIDKNKGRTLQNGGTIYAYLETWICGVKMEEKEIELI